MGPLGTRRAAQAAGRAFALAWGSEFYGKTAVQGKSEIVSFCQSSRHAPRAVAIIRG
jgi:hypothetical protein